MDIERLSNGEKISVGSAILLFVFMFFRRYGIGVAERPNLLYDLHVFEDGGNAWQALEVTPILLTLVIVLTIGVAVQRLIGRDWEPRVAAHAAVCVSVRWRHV